MKRREKDKKYAAQHHWEGFSNSDHVSLQNRFDPVQSAERREDNVQGLSSLGKKRESENNQPEWDLSKKNEPHSLCLLLSDDVKNFVSNNFACMECSDDNCKSTVEDPGAKLKNVLPLKYYDEIMSCIVWS